MISLAQKASVLTQKYNWQITLYFIFLGILQGFQIMFYSDHLVLIVTKK